MGFWSRLLGMDSYDAAQQVLPSPYEPFVSTGGIPVADPGTPLQYWIGGNADAAHMWRTQPNVRKVVGFAARNVASTPLNVYERLSDTNRQRVTDHPLARVVSMPRPKIGPYRFWEAVLSDGLLHDRWAVLKRPQPDGSLRLSRIPAWRLWFNQDVFGEVDGIWMWNGEEWVELDLDLLVFDHGYAPKTVGLSPVDTLRDILDESAEAVEYRRQVWAQGARVPQWVSRDREWSSDGARDRFIVGMRAYTREGGKAGGVPLLEDGMELHDGTKMPSKEMLDLDGRQLSAVETASAWHIAPELIGAREGNYSNVDAYRQMLYRESLGPYITSWEQAINVGLTPDLADGRSLYVEANIEAKLRGSFVEQAQIMQSATGAPWLSRNEARTLQNRPPIAGADELVVPLNVLVGGQASPRDSGSQNLSSADPRTKAAVPPFRSSGLPPALVKALTEQQAQKIEAVMTQFFGRQASTVLGRLGANRDDWWDDERWDNELTKDLLQVTHTLSALVGGVQAEALGFADGYDPDLTVNFLQAVMSDRATGINATTKAQLDAHIADLDLDPATVFKTAKNSRARAAGDSLSTWVSNFATKESAKQISEREGVSFTKTWRTGSNPRSSHARMDGETVDVGEPFSNGQDFPGQSSSAKESAGCNCTLVINQKVPGQPEQPPSLFTAEQLAGALDPGRNRTASAIAKELGKTEAGRDLLASIKGFTETRGGVANLRKNIQKVLDGDASEAVTKRVRAFLDGMNTYPTEDVPTLYRGMAVKVEEDTDTWWDAFEAQFAPGSKIDLNASSFTSSEKKASEFERMIGGTRQAGRNYTAVRFVLEEQPHALPVQQLSKFKSEKEWISGGEFEVVKYDRATPKQPYYRVTIRQKATLQ